MIPHTPGPWREGDTWREIVAHDPADPKRPWKIATVHTGVGYTGYVNDAESKANSRLIAAAPDLLAACKAALADPCKGYSLDHRTEDAIRAAIAKAEKEPS